MAEQITNYQCPSCTAPLRYDGATGKLKCDFCESSFEVPEIEAMYAGKEERAAEAASEVPEPSSDEEEAWDEDGTQMKKYNCPSCGADLICKETTAVTSCPYCGNPQIIPGQFTGAKKPQYILPFQVTKERAVGILKDYYKKKKFLPKIFKEENHIQEIKGVYVPFWLFDGEAEGRMRFHATKSQVFRRGDYRITRTSYFQVIRAGSVKLEKIPADASTRMPDDYMDSIEPFNYAELKDFSTGYLPGYLADQYDVPKEECEKRAVFRAENTILQCLQEDVHGYDTCSVTGKEVDMHKGKVSYAFFPVWMLSTRWGEESYLFAINGQTGKATGVLPIDWKRFWIDHAAIFAALSVAITLFRLVL